jgi:hypothetical protein
LTALGVDVPGINCSTSPEYLIPLVKRMRAFTHLPLLVQPNKGFPVLCQGSVSYAMSDKDFVYYTGKLIDAGASIVGGCCGTTPATIALMAKYKSLPLKEYAPPADSYIVHRPFAQIATRPGLRRTAQSHRQEKIAASPFEQRFRLFTNRKPSASRKLVPTFWI